MDITVQREALLKPLQAVSGVVEKKQTLPILSNVLLTVKDNKLLMIGTDLEIELVGFIHVENPTIEGATTVSARKLFDICRALPENSTTCLTLEKNFLAVRANECSFMLNTLPAPDFPQLEDNDYPVRFTIKQNLIKNLLTKTYFAMGQQDVRHYLNGTYLDISPQSIKCVAADGHRLALASVIDDSIGDVTARVILPRKSVLELIRLFGNECDNDVVVAISENRCRFSTPDFIFTTKLINAQYPDYNRLIPQGMTTAIGDREILKHALIRASILSSEKFRGVRLELEPQKLRVTANNSDQEQAEEAIALEYSGQKMEIAFNVAYLLDVFSTITSKMIRCIFTGPNDGVLIEPIENEQSPYSVLYVVMPMRL